MYLFEVTLSLITINQKFIVIYLIIFHLSPIFVSKSSIGRSRPVRRQNAISVQDGLDS